MDCRVYAATGDPWLMMGGSGSGGGGQMLGGAFSHESEHDLAATATSWRTEVVVVAIQGATATAIPVSANLPTSPTRLRVKSSTVDDEGMRHILLCRVLSGEMEVVKPGSKQCHPSSVEFQTGVDNLKCPRKLIVWSAQLNTHILPEFVISFKTLSASSGPQINRVPCDASSTPLMSIKELISELSKVLPPEVTKKIEEYHRLCTEHKISRRDMVQGFRDSAGDELLRTVVKDLTERHQLKQYK